MKFQSKCETFHSRKCTCEYRQPNGSHFAQGEMSWYRNEWYVIECLIIVYTHFPGPKLSFFYIVRLSTSYACFIFFLCVHLSVYQVFYLSTTLHYLKYGIKILIYLKLHNMTPSWCKTRVTKSPTQKFQLSYPQGNLIDNPGPSVNSPRQLSNNTGNTIWFEAKIGSLKWLARHILIRPV